PITDGAVAVDWDRAEIADFTVDYLLKSPPTGATFADVPAAAAKAKNYATWEKDFSQWLAQSQSIELFRSSRAKVVSALDQSERDFRIHLQTEAREARDAALARVRDKYASKLTQIQDRIRRAEQTVQVQSEQATGAKMGAAVSIGATIFGALLAREGNYGGARDEPGRQRISGRHPRNRKRQRPESTGIRASGRDAGRSAGRDRGLGSLKRAVRARPRETQARRRVGSTRRPRVGACVNDSWPLPGRGRAR